MKSQVPLPEAREITPFVSILFHKVLRDVGFNLTIRNPAWFQLKFSLNGVDSKGLALWREMGYPLDLSGLRNETHIVGFRIKFLTH